MTTAYYHPLREIERLQQDLSRLFEPRDARPAERNAWTPAVDILEREDALLVRAELPGMNQEEIDIELTGDALTVRGERRFDPAPEWRRVERSYGRFSRTFTLTVPIRAEQVSATYRDGILEIVLPKSDENRPRKVLVATE
jgi:HSP20 family protein